MNASRTAAGLPAVLLPAVLLLAVLLLAMLLLAGCAAPAGQGPVKGEVTGRLLREGGPTSPGGQPGPRPMPGTVTFTSTSDRRVMVQAGSSGTF